MEYNKKNKIKIKRQLKIVTCIMISSMLLSLTFMVLNILSVIDNILVFLISTIMMMIFYVIFTWIYSDLQNLKKLIYKTRQSNHLARGIQYLLNGDYKKSQFIFEKCLKSEVDKSFLNGLHKGLCYMSDKEEIKKIATDYLEDYKVN